MHQFVLLHTRCELYFAPSLACLQLLASLQPLACHQLILKVSIMRLSALVLRSGLFALFSCLATSFPIASFGQTSANVLFIRGADRSGGFLEADNDFERTEQLADINNTSTSGGNHGWNELRLTLEEAGFNVSQMAEPLEAGAPSSGQTTGAGIAFDTMDLSVFDVLVFGSNNAVYSNEAVDAIESYIRGGGGAIFISDANFGSDWADASNSDQQFLDRFGLVAHQDQGTYSIERSDDEFLIPDHPIFEGVDRFDGEGVTPIRVEEPTQGVDVSILALAEGQTRLNEGPLGGRNRGESRASGPNDAVLLFANVDQGRIIGHFDRNTFFNLNGAGTNINRFDNRQFAINLFTAAATRLGDFDSDGNVDLDDLDRYSGNIDATATGDLALLDLDGDGIVGENDFEQHYSTLVETSNGGVGTFVGDADLNGTVDVLGDAFTLIGNLGSSVTSWADGDFNADGLVDVLEDAFSLIGNLGRSN